MFDYMIRILPNGRILVRDIAEGDSQVLRADQVSAYFENVLESELEAQKALDDKVSEIKEQYDQGTSSEDSE